MGTTYSFLHSDGTNTTCTLDVLGSDYDENKYSPWAAAECYSSTKGYQCTFATDGPVLGTDCSRIEYYSQLQCGLTNQTLAGFYCGYISDNGWVTVES